MNFARTGTLGVFDWPYEPSQCSGSCFDPKGIHSFRKQSAADPNTTLWDCTLEKLPDYPNLLPGLIHPLSGHKWWIEGEGLIPASRILIAGRRAGERTEGAWNKTACVFTNTLIAMFLPASEISTCAAMGSLH